MKKSIILIFIVMALAQWLVPAMMIWESENTLENGVMYKFKTRPIDPSDPFRGKYVTLSFEASSFVSDSKTPFPNHATVFATITNDTAGFARVVKIGADKPTNNDYVKATIRSSFLETSDNTEIFLEFPFERFYVEESKAAEAEKAYWRASRDSAQQAYALVSIHRGNAVLKDVVINGRSITDIVKQLNQNK